MLLSIQFPLADSRAFLGSQVLMHGRPNWPEPAKPDWDFVRSFGCVRIRKGGGLGGWIGENAICEASRALRFPRLPRAILLSGSPARRLPIKIAFRQFYFDGLAVGKFEVGLAVDQLEENVLSRKDVGDVITTFLRLEVSIPNGTSEPTLSPLVDAGKPLSEIYGYSAMKTKAAFERPPKWWIRRGTPILFFLVHDPSKYLELPFWLNERDINVHGTLSKLSYCRVPWAGRYLPLWVHLNKERTDFRDEQVRAARALRLCLLRLHAERECFRLILDNIAAGDLRPATRSPESDTLQRYLNEATRRISGYNKEADTIAETEVAELARDSEEFVNPGQRDALVNALKVIDIRHQIFRKVEERINQEITVLMEGDQINIRDSQGVITAGRSATAYGIVFNQWQRAAPEMNLESLTKELETLRSQLKAEAKDAEHDAAVGAVAQAETAAKAGDGPQAFQYLAKAGKWALDVATKIGTPLAIAALQKALGM